MTDDVVADFVTDVIPDTGAYDEPVRGRVLMNREQVVIVTADDRTSFAIRDVFDLAFGSAPDGMRRFFETTVTVAYESGGQKRVVLIEGDDVVDRFMKLLFKGILNGTKVTVKHPARVGGRVTDESFRPAKLFVAPTEVRFRSDDSFAIVISTVSGFKRVERDVDEDTQNMLSVRHAPGGTVVTTEIAIASDRKMNILGRYLRIEYSQLKEELSDISLSEAEIEVLVGLYSGASEGNLAGMLGVDASRVTYL
ncbi:MAG: CheF family chemotaxis protein, partial [Halanaeroarchaeum sp.]